MSKKSFSLMTIKSDEEAYSFNVNLFFPLWHKSLRTYSTSSITHHPHEAADHH
jgi:hypothetical protein